MTAFIRQLMAVRKGQKQFQRTFSFIQSRSERSWRKFMASSMCRDEDLLRGCVQNCTQNIRLTISEPLSVIVSLFFGKQLAVGLETVDLEANQSSMT